MKGPFGMLLIGGGIILIVGVFTGKITFQGAVSTPSSTDPSAPVNQISGQNPNTAAPVNNKCQPGWQLAPTGVCMRIGAIK